MCPISTVPYMNREPVQMMVMGCAFSCLDPVLSVVTALDYKTPFYITNKASNTSDPGRCRITLNQAIFFLNMDPQKGFPAVLWIRTIYSRLGSIFGKVSYPVPDRNPDQDLYHICRGRRG